MNTYLKAKTTLNITGCEVEYKGSLTLDQDLMDKLGVVTGEQVFVNSKYGMSRIMTYLIPGKRGSGACEVNGGAAIHFEIGDTVHLLFFSLSDKPIKSIVL